MSHETLVLCKKQWISSKNDKRAYAIVSLLIVLAPVVMLLIMFPPAQWAMLPWERLPAGLLAKFAKTPELVVVLFAIPAHLAFIFRAEKFERLILSPEGIRYVSPMPAPLKALMPDWSLTWGEVHAIELKPSRLAGGGPMLATLALKHGDGERKLCPLLWVDPETYTPPRKMVISYSLRFTRPVVVSAETAVPESEVMRYIRKAFPKLPVESRLNDSTLIPTGLEKDPHGKAGTLLILLLIAYTLVDLLIGPESYIDQPPHLFYFASGLLAALLAGLWLSRSKLLLAEKIGLALLIGMVASAAMLPGALRINALFNNAQVHDYRIDTSGNGILLQPLDEGLPSIDYFADNDYWGRYGKEDVYPVRVRKGILGFYQFDAAAITDEIHRFHLERKAGN